MEDDIVDAAHRMMPPCMQVEKTFKRLVFAPDVKVEAKARALESGGPNLGLCRPGPAPLLL